MNYVIYIMYLINKYIYIYGFVAPERTTSIRTTNWTGWS